MEGGGFGPSAGQGGTRGVLESVTPSVCPKTCCLEAFALPRPLPQKYKLVFLLFFCDSGHQQEVAGHELHIQHSAHLAGVDTQELTGRAIGGRAAVLAVDVPDTH